MDQTQKLAVAQMRESVEKFGSSTQGYNELTLMRFLVARSMDRDKAAKMFVQWQKWRTSFVPLGYFHETEVQDELSAEKIYLQGITRKGFPVVVVKACKHYPSKDQLQFKKFVVHLLDKTIASAPGGGVIGNEKLIGVLDLQQLSYKNIDARGLITAFQFLQAYYPERLAKCYILHMPGFFLRVWRLVSRFLEKATLEKILIVSNDEEKSECIREVGEEVLPEEYGGNAKFIAIQNYTVKPLED